MLNLYEIPDSVEILNAALETNHADINMKDKDGRTLLLKSINMNRSDSFIMRLLNANSDPNISDTHQETPLYAAVTRSTIFIAHELIKRGANINAVTKTGYTALHQAIDYHNLDAACLLLYYRADANVVSGDNRTPFAKALSYNDDEVSEILINYHEQDEDANVLFLAVQERSTLAVQLLESGTDVNFISPHNENLLYISLFYDSATLFNLIWERFDYEIILNNKYPFLLTYIRRNAFCPCDWLDSLNLVLNSSIAFELAQQYNNYNKDNKTNTSGFFQKLLYYFHGQNVTTFDRLRIIYSALRLGVTVNICDLKTAYKLFGFNEEFEIFIYFIKDVKINSDLNFLLIPFILGLKDDFDLEIIEMLDSFEMYKYDWVGFFAQTFYNNFLEKFPNLWRLEYQTRLLNVPKFPSLFELSRNQARKYIKQTYNVTKPYHFHDIVKNLNLPLYIKDVIRFKVPIYK